MSGKRFEGKNLEEALESAARSFGVERFRVSYHVVLEKRGFLGGTKRVVIEADVSDTSLPDVDRSRSSEPDRPREKKRREPKERSREKPKSSSGRDMRPERESKPEGEKGPEREERQRSGDDSGRGENRGRRRGRGGRGRGSRGAEERPPEREPRREQRPRPEPVEAPPQGEQSEEAAKIAAWCGKVFELSGLDLVARTTDSEDEIAVELFGSDVSLIEEGAGDYIDSLQVLANKAFTGRQIERRIEFDAAGFKQRREEELSERARDLAQRVREEQRERTMRAMSPIERRIVHLSLENEKGVTTESRGRGFHKRVAIIPSEEDDRAISGES